MTLRTFRGSRLKKIRTSGFRTRMRKKSGRKILNLRRKKGKNKLSM
jgi:large subunit ribosomal protein L34